jgi:tetratricopeptide (TPR) repeat protein
MKMKLLWFTRMLSIILLIGLAMPVLGQTEEQKKHPKYAELEEHFKAWKQAKDQNDQETFQKEMYKINELEVEIFGESHLKSAEVINHLGLMFLEAGQFDNALQRFDFSLKVRIKFLGDNDSEVGISYSNIGEAYRYKGEYDKAIGYYEKSLTILVKTFNETHQYVATVYNNQGLAYDSKGDYEKAIASLEKSLSIRLKILAQDHPDIAISYNSLGETYRSKGDYNKAIDYHEKSLAIRSKKFSDTDPRIAISYNNLGIVYFLKGECNKAIEYSEKALDIRLKILKENNPLVATSYNNLAGSYYCIGEYYKAIGYAEKSLIISKNIGEKYPDTGISYMNAAAYYQEVGNYEKAFEYFEKAFGIFSKTVGENSILVAKLYNILGRAHKSKNEYDKAIDYYKKSLTIFIRLLKDNHPNVAGLYNNLGSIYDSKTEYETALVYINKALGIYKQSEERTNYLKILDNTKLLYQKLNKIPETISTLEEAIGVVLKARNEIVGRDKQAFTEKHIHFFEELVNLYNQTGQQEKAFEISEKMRGLSILESFQLQFALKESGVKQKVVTDMLNRKGKIESLYSEFSAVLRQGEKGQVYAKTLKEKILLEERELERVDRNLENSNPLYAKNRKIKIPDIKNLQTKLGESKKTLLEFTLSKDSEGKETLTAFVISKTKFDPVVLGAKLHLSLQINNLRQLISVNPDRRNLILAKTADNLDFLLGSSASEYQCKYKDDDERKKCEGFEEGTEIFKEEWNNSKEKLQSLDGVREPQKVWKKFAVMERQIPKEEATNTWLPFYLKEVYKTVIHPLYEKKLIETKEILISPDASLFTVPFSALLTSENKYWSEKATISLIHSASIWMKLKETQKREYSHPIYAMGNPVYALSHSDTKGVRSSDLRAVSRGESMDTLKLGNLKGSKEEMIFITNEIYKQEKSEHVKGGLFANKQDLADNFAERKPIYKTVHFSAHGLFFPDAAELNSLALTSRAKAEEFKLKELEQYETSSKKKFPVDGFLKMGDVVDLGIKTDLIVMSACETSLGTERAGEGMVGLPQAFLIAGSQNTLATLWSVDDNGTTVFFKKFYQHYIIAPNKLNSSMSLQKSQWETFGNKDKAKDKFKDPYFWAPFVVYGE